jgi:RNA polymerase sigma-70 factor (ECF subfamily)
MMGYNSLMKRRSDLISGAVIDPDYALMRAIARGEVPAFEEFYNRHAPRLLAYLISRLGERQLAEEVLQDVMLAVWRGAERFRGESRVRTWMISIARHKAINTMQRQRYVQASDIHKDLPDPAPGPSSLVEREDALAQVRDALRRLPDAQRETLELIFFHQLSGNEVAQVMGVSPGTVKSRLHRAKANLIQLLTSQGDSDE